MFFHGYLGSVLCLLLLLQCRLGAGLFEGCDDTYYLGANRVAYMRSPYYPRRYPPQTSCRYRFVAPLDYELVVNCTIELDRFPNSCSTEIFYISREGDDKPLQNFERFCGAQHVFRVSDFRNTTIAYSSAVGSRSAGRFQCQITSRPKECECGWSMSTRIIGGVEAGVNEFPSMVALLKKAEKKFFCGASIISHRYILTAAHCGLQEPNASNVIAVVGDHDLSNGRESVYTTSHQILKIILHPDYDVRTDKNDIALMQTAGDIQWSRGVGPACLPFSRPNDQFVYNFVEIVGWGDLKFGGSSSPTLQKGSVFITDKATCDSSYENIDSSQFCTYRNSTDACQYDSGGPVFLRTSRMFVVGCISYGKPCGSAPGVNTRVTSHLRWIWSYVKSGACFKSM